MDPALNNLFTRDGWIITKNTKGKTKVASCSSDETNIFNRTRDNWVTFHESEYLRENEESDKIESQITFKPLFQQITGKNIEKRIGVYLIRDLLNFKKPNSFSKAFIADNLPLTRVAVCARIISYQQKNNVYRLILDDGTSSILCIVKIKDDNGQLQDSNCEEISKDIETPYCKKEVPKNNSVLWAINKVTLQGKKITEDSALNFNQMSLGRPVRIMGNLRQFCGKTFIFAYKFKWITEKYFVNFLSYIINSYEYKENYMLE